MKEFSSSNGSSEKMSASPEKIPAKPMRLLENGKEQIVDGNAFMERLDVTNWVRIPREEFEDNFETVDVGQLIDHFNLGSPNHVPGKRYVFMKIEKGGGALPLLSTDKAFVVECVAEQDFVLDSLTPVHFEHSFKGIDDKESLIALIQKRYGADAETIAKRGIAHTRFRVIERIDIVNKS